MSERSVASNLIASPGENLLISLLSSRSLSARDNKQAVRAELSTRDMAGWMDCVVTFISNNSIIPWGIAYNYASAILSKK